VLTDGKTLPRAVAAGQRLKAGLEKIAATHPETAVEVRGAGLMLGVEIESPSTAREIAQAALAQGLLINVTGNGVLRIAPPLTVSDAEIDEGLAILEGVFRP
jgi:4-aminobutyrate aminotransferase-like enzyme